MAKEVKCPHCEKYFKKEEQEYVHQRNRYWHKKCFESANKEILVKQKLLDYIEKILYKKPDYKINSQITNFMKSKNLTYEQIYNALYYFYEIKGNSTAKANGGIGIVPYVVEEAEEYFKEKKKRVALSPKQDPIIGIKIIKIKDPTYKKKYSYYKTISISDI